MLKHFVPRATCVLQASRVICPVRLATTDEAATYVPFGKQNIRIEEKTPKVVNEVFTSVAKKYDLMNDLMSAGVHRIWKNHLVENHIAPGPSYRVLDVGGGTGDIAFRIVDFMRRQTTKVDGAVTVLDPTAAMMEVGKKRAAEGGMANALNWVVGTGENMPFPEGEFDAVTMAFSLRNCADPLKTIEQAYRVLRPGGRYFILEFFRVDTFPFSMAYDCYLDFLPVTGFLITGNWGAYQYLADSIRRMNTQAQLMGHMRKTGFVDVSCEKMIPVGVACILSGKKPA